MVHGTNGLHVVRIVNGTNSLVIHGDADSSLGLLIARS